MKIDFYQTIPELNIVGRMNTPEEFDKIGLPRHLDGLSVLDIGCNTGAFMIECINRGAEVCTGIEPDLNWRLLANGIMAELEIDNKCFIRKDLDEVELPYDLILLLSVTHVTDNPQELIDKAYKKLNTMGMMIVEINDRLQKEPIKLPKSAKFYGKNKDDRSVYWITKV